MNSISGHIGRKTLSTVDHIGILFTFTAQLLRLLIFPPRTGRVWVRRTTIEQVYFTAVQALPLVLPTAIIIGSMIIIQFSKFSGQYDLGRITVLLLVRELGPILTALLIILRSASAVTIEISYMSVLNEIDALEMSGIDPLWAVCIPRLIGITSAILCLFIVFDIVAIIGGYYLVWLITPINLGNYLIQIANAISPADIIVGLIKALLFGIDITVICLYHGFRTKAHMTQVPVATSQAAVQCFISCLVISFTISTLFYL